jgi:hypothetical protein
MPDVARGLEPDPDPELIARPRPEQLMAYAPLGTVRAAAVPPGQYWELAEHRRAEATEDPGGQNDPTGHWTHALDPESLREANPVAQARQVELNPGWGE